MTKRKSHDYKSAFASVLIHLVLIVMLAFALMPIIYIIGLSFSKGSNLYMDSLIPSHPTLDNFRKLLMETDFPRWYLNTIEAGAMTSVITVILVTPTAYAFSGPEAVPVSLTCTSDVPRHDGDGGILCVAEYVGTFGYDVWTGYSLCRGSRDRKYMVDEGVL